MENTQYIKTMSLTSGAKYKIQLQCVAKRGFALSSSGFRVLWNGATVIDGSVPSDYDLHTYSTYVVASGVTNTLILEGRGTVDSQGSTCDNV